MPELFRSAFQAGRDAEAARYREVDPDDADFRELALLDQPLSTVTEDGDHDHTGVPCRTCVVLGAEDWSVERIANALPYGDFPREPGEDFLAWRRRFAERIVEGLSREFRAQMAEARRVLTGGAMRVEPDGQE